MSSPITLGGTASKVSVGKIAHGLMSMTWTSNPVSDEVAFAAMKASLDSVPPGSKMVINSGEFYGNPPNSTANVELVSRFFEKYPEYVDRAFLSVKGGFKLENFTPDSSEEGLRKSVDNILEKLRGKKHLDVFEPARVDPTRPIEETMNNMVKLVKEGKFDHIGLSECSAATLRRAHAVYPVTGVEIEISLFAYEEETKNVISTAKELGITVFGYSPIGSGILSGNISKQSDLQGFIAHIPRFQGEQFEHNMQIVHKLAELAEKKGFKPAQLAIAWVSSLGQHVIPLPGSAKEHRVLENLAANEIKFSVEELKELNDFVDNFEVKGARTVPALDKLSWG